MRSQTVIGIAFLVMAAGLGAFELLLPQFSTVRIPESVAVQSSDAPLQTEISATGPDWESEQPSQERLPARKHLVKMRRVAAARPRRVPAKVAPVRVARQAAPERPLVAPTFLPSTPMPAPPVRVYVGNPSAPTKFAQPLFRPTPHPPHARQAAHRRPVPVPTAIRALPTFSPEDLERQRVLERQALVNAAVRSARAEVMSSVSGGVVPLSAEAEDHGTSISVVVVEQRSSGTVVEDFTFTPGPSGLGLSQRRVISQNYADPFISH